MLKASSPWRSWLSAIAFGTMGLAAPAAAITGFNANEGAGTVGMTGVGSVSDARPFCPTTGPACGSYAASASTSAALGGSVEVMVSLTGVPLLGGNAQDNFYTSATANVYYGIELLGTPGVLVPVTVIATLTASPASGYLSDASSLTIASQVGDYYAAGCGNGVCSPISPQPVMLRSGVEYLVTLQASATALADGTVSASVDPSFIVDPAFSSQFQLVGVPGVAPAAVPEPQGWALLIGGFGLVGGAVRRRRGEDRRRPRLA